MDSIFTMHRRDHRERQRADCKAICAIESSNRRKMVRVCDDWVCMCQHSPVLLSHGEGAQPRQTGDRTTPLGMEQTKGGDTTTTPEIPSAIYSPTVFDSTRSSKSSGRSIVQRMSSVSIRRTTTFDKHITVFYFTDWSPEIYRAARQGPWMQLAVDRHRFKRRIQQTELVLGNIFTDVPRNKMWFYVNNKLCV